MDRPCTLDRVRLCALLLLTSCILPVLSAAGQPIRIMPLGDSITESGPGEASYRYYLWQFLHERGIAADFVGSMTGVRGGVPRYGDFDQQHEGHSGWRADQIRDRIVPWATAARPDLVLVHLGTNDLWQGRSVPETAQAIGEVIERLRSVNPHIHILLAQIIPSTLKPLQAIAGFNQALAAVAKDRSTTESPIVLVDLATGFDPATMTSDGVHPNAQGERMMAQRWGTALQSLLISMSKPGTAQ